MNEVAIRIRFDLLYKVPADLAEEVLEEDLGTFDHILSLYENWNHNPNEVRKLIKADVTHHTGKVEDEIKEHDL